MNEGTHSISFTSSSGIAICPFKQDTSVRTSGFHTLTFRPDVPSMQTAVSKYLPHTDALFGGIAPDSAQAHRSTLGDVNYHHQLMSLLEIVNSCGGNTDFLARIGIADVITQILADFLVKTTGKPLEQADRMSLRRSDKSVDIICDQIINCLGTPLTIPQMEKLTGMTGRAINYAFQGRFGKSPQQWQRDHLLDLARQEMTNSTTPRSVKSIAFDLGFSSPSSFSMHYKRRFGELPSFTSGRVSSRPLKLPQKDT